MHRCRAWWQKQRRKALVFRSPHDAHRICMRLLLAWLVLLTTAAHADDGGLLSGLFSTPLSVPVTISGNELALDGYVIRPDGPGRFPLVIMVHGTPSADGAEFFHQIARQSPVNFNSAAIAFAVRGYAAVSIMRRGFGRSGGAYSERLQTACDYLPAVRISAEDVTAAIASLRTRPWVDPNRIVLLGHSTGGLAVLAAAAMKPSGVLGVLNFDGGRHASSGPGQTCNLDKLIDTVATLGHSVRIPSLWLYAQNDQSYGPDLARRMLDAYIAGGAPAQFNLMPSFEPDGHNLIILASADIWLPSVEPFLAGLGLPTTPIITLPPVPQLPPPSGLLPVCQKIFATYATYRSDAKAFAMTPRGGCGAGFGRTQEEASANATTDCETHTHGGYCSLYAIGQQLSKN